MEVTLAAKIVHAPVMDAAGKVLDPRLVHKPMAGRSVDLLFGIVSRLQVGRLLRLRTGVVWLELGGA